MLDHELRSKGVGGSEIAAVAGLSPWKSKHDVWAEKMGMVERRGSAAMQWGHDVEEVILAHVARRSGLLIKHNSNEQTHVSKSNPLVRATPDGYVLEKEEFDGGSHVKEMVGVAEAKNVTWRLKGDWADPEEVPDGVPVYVLPQCIWQMEAMDLRECVVGAQIGGAAPRIYRVPYDAELSDKLQQVAEEFWKYVEAREPPPVDDRNVSQAQRWLKEYYRSHDTEEMLSPGTEEIEIKLREYAINYQEASSRRKQAEMDMDYSKAYLMEHIKTAPGIVGEGWRVTWRADQSGRVDWKSMCESTLSTEEIKKLSPDHRYQPRRSFRVTVEDETDG